jgi:hypothetical protein
MRRLALQVNLVTSFNILKASVKAMLAEGGQGGDSAAASTSASPGRRGGGSIVLVSAALTSHGIPNYEAMSAAKAAVQGRVVGWWGGVSRFRVPAASGCAMLHTPSSRCCCCHTHDPTRPGTLGRRHLQRAQHPRQLRGTRPDSHAPDKVRWLWGLRAMYRCRAGRQTLRVAAWPEALGGSSDTLGPNKCSLCCCVCCNPTRRNNAGSPPTAPRWTARRVRCTP